MTSTKKDSQLEEILDDPLPSLPVEQEIGQATLFVYVLVFCVCVGGFLFGYDTGGKAWAIIIQGEKKGRLTLDTSF